jgi:hypothetical protein
MFSLQSPLSCKKTLDDLLFSEQVIADKEVVQGIKGQEK